MNKLVINCFDDLEVKPLKVLNEYTTNYNIKKYVLNIHKEVNSSIEKHSNSYYELNHEYLHFPTLDIEKYFDECITAISESYKDSCKIITDKSQKPWFSSLRKQAYIKYKKDKQTNIFNKINTVIEPIFSSLKQNLEEYFLVFFEKGVDQINSSIYSNENKLNIINQSLKDSQNKKEIFSKSKKLLEEQRLLFVEM